MIRVLLLFLGILASSATAQTTVPTSQMEIRMSFAPLVKQVAPAVVNIYARQLVATRESPFEQDPFFRDMFRGFGQPRLRQTNSLGSGVILTSSGLVISNYHVVGSATEIRVILNDGREFDASVIMGDQEGDLALLQLEGASDLPTVALRDSDSVEVGELVLAIGNPFGVGQTVSSGIVSGLARSGAAAGGSSQGYFIQTDAPINPGNSGGALIDMNGQLIGVNTSILSRSGGSNGIGFAIPSNLVAQFLQQAKDGNTSFQRPWAGISGQPIDSDLAETLGLTKPEGIVISGLHDESPFSKAGFLPGDVITEVDGLAVNSGAEMQFRMTVKGVGASIDVTRVREGVSEVVTVALISPPDVPSRDRRTMTRQSAVPALVVENINPAVASEYNLPINAQGVIVADPGEYGARIGLRQGDILLLLNGEETSTTQMVEDILSKDMRSLRLDVLRAGQRLVMRVRL